MILYYILYFILSFVSDSRAAQIKSVWHSYRELCRPGFSIACFTVDGFYGSFPGQVYPDCPKCRTCSSDVRCAVCAEWSDARWGNPHQLEQEKQLERTRKLTERVKTPPKKGPTTAKKKGNAKARKKPVPGQSRGSKSSKDKTPAFTHEGSQFPARERVQSQPHGPNGSSVVSVVKSGTGHMELTIPPVAGQIPVTELNRVQYRGFHRETRETGPSAAGNSPEAELNRVQYRGFHRETGGTGPSAAGNSPETELNRVQYRGFHRETGVTGRPRPGIPQKPN